MIPLFLLIVLATNTMAAFKSRFSHSRLLPRKKTVYDFESFGKFEENVV